MAHTSSLAVATLVIPASLAATGIGGCGGDADGPARAARHASGAATASAMSTGAITAGGCLGFDPDRAVDCVWRHSGGVRVQRYRMGRFPGLTHRPLFCT
jgi:hypothetical protein